jgi:hypothetical protein
LLTVLGYSHSKGKIPQWHCKCDCGTEKVISGKYLKCGDTKSCGCLNYSTDFLDISGNTYGNLKVVSFAKKVGVVRFFNVLCKCGNTKIVRGGDLKSGATVSCGCHQTTSKLIAGQKFERLTVIGQVESKTRGISIKCVCDCGKEVIAKNHRLLEGSIKSCGCIRKGILIKDITGQVFGQLTVLGHSHTDKFAYWHVKCTCGRVTIKNGSYMRAGNTASCGCRKRNYEDCGVIYGLIDKAGVIHYVGQTIQRDLNIRLEQHLKIPVNQLMKKWLNSLGYAPTIVPLMKNVPVTIIDYAEKKAIRFYNKKHVLNNVAHNRKLKERFLDLF